MSTPLTANGTNILLMYVCSHAIAPRYEALSKKYTNTVFTKCDVDKAQDVAKQYSISAMPSFVFLKSGTKVDMVRGADPAGLESAIQRHSGPAGAGATAAFSGKGQTLGGGNTTGKASVVGSGGGGIPFELSKVDPQAWILFGLVGL